LLRVSRSGPAPKRAANLPRLGVAEHLSTPRSTARLCGHFDVPEVLRRAPKERPPNERQGYIKRNGGTKWSPIKDLLTVELGNKCWYTEAELVGADLTIDHYRPKCDYWWLAFDASNFRVACPYANSPKHNEMHGSAGGKGEEFPLFPPGVRGTDEDSIKLERPIILDPCEKADCELLAFQADGRPILNPAHAADPIAKRRVEESKVLLNLDHPDFNSKREQLCNDISEDVSAYEAVPEHSPVRTALRVRMEKRLSASAPFSTAVRYYLQFHRHLSWVEDLLNEQ
jgi:hypothetical protein